MLPQDEGEFAEAIAWLNSVIAQDNMASQVVAFSKMLNRYQGDGNEILDSDFGPLAKALSESSAVQLDEAASNASLELVRKTVDAAVANFPASYKEKVTVLLDLASLSNQAKDAQLMAQGCRLYNAGIDFADRVATWEALGESEQERMDKDTDVKVLMAAVKTLEAYVVEAGKPYLLQGERFHEQIKAFTTTVKDSAKKIVDNKVIGLTEKVRGLEKMSKGGVEPPKLWSDELDVDGLDWVDLKNLAKTCLLTHAASDYEAAAVQLTTQMGSLVDLSQALGQTGPEVAGFTETVEALWTRSCEGLLIMVPDPEAAFTPNGSASRRCMQLRSC